MQSKNYLQIVENKINKESSTNFLCIHKKIHERRQQHDIHRLQEAKKQKEANRS